MKTIFFDFDGTLANSLPNYMNFYEQVCEKLGLQKRWTNEKTFRLWVSGSWKKEMKSLGVSLTKELVQEQIMPIFIKEFVSQKPPLHHGIKHMLKDLKEKNMFILSGSQKEHIKHALTKAGAIHYFQDIYSRDHGGVEKPDPESFWRIMQKHNLNPKNVIYVGDMQEDVQYAKQADVTSVAITYGWQPKARLKKMHPDYLINSVRALRKLLIEIA